MKSYSVYFTVRVQARIEIIFTIQMTQVQRAREMELETRITYHAFVEQLILDFGK